MFSVLALDANDSEDRYHSSGFKKTLEDFMPVLKTSEKTKEVPLDYALSRKWTGDFYGLLKELNVPYNYRWAIMRANGMHSATDWEGEELSLIVLASTEIDALLAKYLTTESGI